MVRSVVGQNVEYYAEDALVESVVEDVLVELVEDTLAEINEDILVEIAANVLELVENIRVELDVEDVPAINKDRRVVIHRARKKDV